MLAVSLSLMGCAQHRLAQEPGLVTQWDRRQPLASDAPAPDITLVLRTRYLKFGQPADPSMAKWWSKHKVREQLTDVMGEFPCLARARWDGEEAGAYRLVIEATHAIRGRKFLNALSSTSRYVIPSSSTGAIELDALVARGDALLKRYDAVGTYAIKRHALFLLAPMWWGYRVPSATMEDTFRDLFLQLQRDASTLFAEGGG